MIITVTVNPAIDITARSDRLALGETNRLSESVINAGGKGINAARMIRALGGEALAVGFAGGATGELLLSLLEREGLPHRFIAAGETRVNTKIVDTDGVLTELNGAGSEAVVWREMEILLLELCVPERIFVLSGSLPPGAEPGWYGKMIHALRERGAKVILDTSGEALRLGARANPDALKPNRDEMAMIDRTAYGGLLVNSLGSEGVRFFHKGQTWFIPGLPVTVASPAGAGDCMTGALAFALERELPPEEMFLLSAAAATAGVITGGTACPSLAAVLDCRKQLTIVRE